MYKNINKDAFLSDPMKKTVLKFPTKQQAYVF